MTYEFIDRNKETLREGFYWDDSLKQPIYFTGEYDPRNHALVESYEGEILTVDSNHSIEHLCRFQDPNKYTMNQLNIIGWMIDKLSKLEEINLRNL